MLLSESYAKALDPRAPFHLTAESPKNVRDDSGKYFGQDAALHLLHRNLLPFLSSVDISQESNMILIPLDRVRYLGIQEYNNPKWIGLAAVMVISVIFSREISSNSTRIIPGGSF